MEILNRRPPLLYYSLFLPEGNYNLSFFADLNRDGFFGRDELVGRTNSGHSLSVKGENAEDNALVKGPEIRIDVDHPSRSDLPVHTRVMVQSNKYESLDDEFFDPHYGTMGLYRPTEFLAHTQGAFFQLEDYDRKKTMVLFVHGVEGTPRDWKYFVEGLDRNRFQPWFYYYPSGLPLERLGNFLAYYIMNLHQTPGYGINRLVIVSHSMGGGCRPLGHRPVMPGRQAFLPEIVDSPVLTLLRDRSCPRRHENGPGHGAFLA